jgi:hypothetical protein
VTLRDRAEAYQSGAAAKREIHRGGIARSAQRAEGELQRFADFN